MGLGFSTEKSKANMEFRRNVRLKTIKSNQL